MRKAPVEMTPLEASVRLAVYQFVTATGRVPSPVDLSSQFDVSATAIGTVFHTLADAHDALVLLPDSPYIWMAEPFSGVPTDYPVLAADGRRWFGNCIWDAMAIASLVGVDTAIRSICPVSGERLELTVASGRLGSATGVVHFAVAARDWWRSIGFT